MISGSSAVRSVLISLAAVVLALATAAVLLALAGADPLASLSGLFQTAFGSQYAIGVTITKSVPRLLAALGIAFALRAGLWNIGAEGQLYMGAAACTAVALMLPEMPRPFGIVTALAAAMLGGAAWAAIAAALRAYRGVNEVITTLMLVYVAIQATNFLIEGPWLAEGSTWPATPMLAQSWRLPVIWPNTLVNAGVLVALLAAVVLGFIVSRTPLGLHMRAMGGNERASAVMGLSNRTLIMVALAGSGAFAGLAGAVEVLGSRGRLLEGFSPGYGFEAIAIALLGRLHPVGIIAAALLFGALDAGSAGLQVASSGVSSAIAPVIEGLAVAYLLAGLGIASLVSRQREARSALIHSSRS